MNYYKQGDAANADKIKAAFESKGYDISWPGGCANPDVINIGVERNGAKYVVAETSEYIKDIIKTHPNYKELEPLHKFKKGDLLVHNSNNTCIISVVDVSEKYGYQVQDGGSRYHLSFTTVENGYHLWSIQDANDGDVLATDNGWTCIFKAFDGRTFSSYCFMDSQNWFCESGSEVHIPDSRINGKIHPATKEQRDLLFAKMEEAGYEWDANKMELKKLKKHYDISNFKPFDNVLVRDSNGLKWTADLFSYIDDGFVCTGGIPCRQCIPFNEKTKHLLGTTDMCDECYVNW